VNKKRLSGLALAIAVIAMGVIQFIPSPPLLVPGSMPLEQRNAHRLLNFEGIPNVRDLGGYETADGKHVMWGKLYRAGTFAEASRADLKALPQLGLKRFIDFRSAAEKEEEPNQLPDPPGFEMLEIPILDEGNKAMATEIMARIEANDFAGYDPNKAMLQANRQFASDFTPQYSEFIHIVLEANGAPVIWHCSAGKDRTGFAAAILLRILGVPQETVMQDYMASREPALAAREGQLRLLRLFKGEETAGIIQVLLGVEEAWLRAAFEQIDTSWGDFDSYVQNGLKLSRNDIQRLRDQLLN
jgi:protein-tyrosine phosphatase